MRTFEWWRWGNSNFQHECRAIKIHVKNRLRRRLRWRTAGSVDQPGNAVATRRRFYERAHFVTFRNVGGCNAYLVTHASENVRRGRGVFFADIGEHKVLRDRGPARYCLANLTRANNNYNFFHVLLFESGFFEDGSRDRKRSACHWPA